MIKIVNSMYIRKEDYVNYFKESTDFINIPLFVLNFF